MNKRDLSERDICSQFIGPAIDQGGWDRTTQVREEVSFTKGRIIVRGKLVSRGKAKRADYILYYKPNIPIAIVEAKDNCHSVGEGTLADCSKPYYIRLSLLQELRMMGLMDSRSTPCQRHRVPS